MRAILIMFILLIAGNYIAFSNNKHISIEKDNTLSPSIKRTINANDTVIFDLANATLTATYIDLPIYIISDDPIFALDYAVQFNLSKLTFSTTIDLVTQDTSYTSLSHFNTSDLFLRYTGGSALRVLPSGSGLHVTKIRFAVNAACTEIVALDIIQIKAYLNGTICSSRVTNSNFVQYIPIAGFNTGPTCLNASVQFSDTSKIGNGSISSWLWTFDDGSSSTLQNPSVSYTAAGISSATLIVTGSTGCADTVINALTINLPPVSSFSYSFDCVKDSVFFSNSSTVTNGSIISSLWNFGDGSGVSALTNPSYRYNASILYTVTLLSTSDFSCAASTSVIVNLSNTVSANFTTNSLNNCAGSVINFNDASTYSLNVINAWIWNFGDGNTSTLQNPSYTYTVSGVYSVSLTSTSAEGCKDTVSRTILIYLKPVVGFGVASLTTCIVANASFTNLTTTSAGSNYLWDFGNGITSNLPNPSYSYSLAGNYPVKIVVTTTAGCQDSLTKNYSVFFPAPAEAFFSTTTVTTSVLSFSSTTPKAVKFIWDFGDNQTSLLDNPSHTFSDIRTYNVCLTAYDSLDCIYTTCKEVYVGLARIVAVPSAFTPNDDNINDILNVRGGPFAEFKFQIFNEWGNLLFSSPSQEIGWDGTFNGEAQPVGVYEYVLRCKTLDNEKINRYGVVNLAR